jgi:hypothetical protein
MFAGGTMFSQKWNRQDGRFVFEIRKTGEKNMGQKNRNGGQDFFYFPVRHFPIDRAICRGLRAQYCHFFACFRGSSFGLT